ncbi:MAG TPA: hypothetical protein VGQ81_16350 [Acidobacteriota bacterium]|jgi:hypothetical protein|nr:hypothetical protein [Acidobacteriota bacterium]
MSPADSNSPQPQPAIQVMQILWVAMFLGQGLLLFISWMLSRSEAGRASPMELPFSNPLVLTFAVIALVGLGLSLNIHKLLPRVGDETGQAAIQSISPSDPKKLIPLYVVRLALLELAGVCGFVLSFLTANLIYMLPFLAATVLGFLVSYPSPEFLEKISERS